ncbi:hypothetical protein [Microbacterium sp.]|uniref:hypothetical protein n=1 Tax=Microbacterium sp. TaxID=51671 RepID=UPI002734B0BD|nr:hypothetical protein [Microbacterium sp.]MDP3951153.1 hypothetical protein [Microbacterium sp.]
MTVEEDDLVVEYLAAIDELFEHWEAVDAKNLPLAQPAARSASRFSGKDLTRLAIVKGLACYVFDTGKAISTLHAARQINAMIPLVRLAYESALNVSLLVQSLDQHGVDAFMHEYSRQRAALQLSASRSPSEVFREGAPDVSGIDGSPFKDSHDSVRHFHQICEDLTPGGPDAYLYYRLLSAYSHPGVGVTDLYFEDNGQPGLPTFLGEAKEALPGGMLLFFTAASLLWSARAYSYLTRDQADRDFLRSVGRRIGVADSLALSDDYRRRHAARARAEREARRHGP